MQKSELSGAEDKIYIYFLTQLNYMVVTNHTATASANIYHQISWFVPSLVLHIHSLNLQLFFCSMRTMPYFYLETSALPNLLT